jgi:hypothetical protein
MNSFMRKSLKFTTLTGSLLIIGVIVSACGDGGSSQSAGIGGTGITTARGYVQGKVTGFGSIFVNGDRFDTDTSEFFVDGIDGATQDDLAIGMVVTLEVEIEDGVYTGKAFDVIYDDEVQGPVTASPVVVPGSDGAQKTFEIFGQTVTIDNAETVFAGTSFADLQANDVVEVSGFRISPNEIDASYIEWKETLTEGSEVELRGTISGYAPPVMEFMLDSTLIIFDNATEIETESGALDNGLYVEVEGLYRFGPPVSVFAEEIEEEDEGIGIGNGDDINDVSLQGVISNYVDISDFQINGQQVDASQAELLPANAETLLADGVEVEVDGDIVGGVLMADELELRDGETRLKAFVSSKSADNTRFEVSFTGLPGSIEVITDNQTLFEDESPLELPNFSVADLSIGDFVSVEGVESVDEVAAETVKRLDPDDSELRGQVDAFVVDTSITVLGITFGVNAGTQYEDSSGPVSSAVFFANLAIGDLVEIEDEEVADGIADEAELED